MILYNCKSSQYIKILGQKFEKDFFYPLWQICQPLIIFDWSSLLIYEQNECLSDKMHLLQGGDHLLESIRQILENLVIGDCPLFLFIKNLSQCNYVISLD